MGRQVAKRSSDPPGSLSRNQSLGTGPSASMGIVASFVPLRVGTRGKFVLSSPGMGGGEGPRRRVPCGPSSGTPREPGKVQGLDRVGIVGSCGYWARRVSIREKFVLSRNLGYNTRWVAKKLNVFLIPG